MPTVSHKTATALLVAAALFMEILDATIITTALPIIAAEFGVPAAHLSVGVSAYLVAVTIFIPISGWAADRFGAKRIFSLAILIFVIASVLCGFSQSLSQFTLARILQGIGGAMMVPVGRLVVLRNLPKAQIVKAMAILTWPALGAPLIGPVLGGWIAETWHWSWIFFINVPLGAIALLFAYWLLNNDKGQWQQFDTVGFILSASGFGMLMAGLESFSARPEDISLPLILVISGAGILALAIRHMLTASNPLFSLSALSFSTFRASMTGGSVIRVSLSSAPFIIPLMLQVGLGYSAIEAGTLLLWLFAGNLAIKPATTWIMNTFGFKQVLIYNTLLVALGFFVLAVCDADTAAWLLGVILFLSGMTRSMHLTLLNTLSFADVPQTHIRDANTLSAVIMQMTRGMGITAGALALALATFIIDDTRTTPITEDFQLTMVFMGIIALLSLINSVRLKPDIGDEVLTQRQARRRAESV